MLHEWLLSMGHVPDDRLCTTLMRVCATHGQPLTALSLYDWMKSRPQEGGAGLVPTVFTYTAAMRAALTGNLLDRALSVWDDAMQSRCEPDCRMCTTLIEVCARKGDTQRALDMYDRMRNSRPDSKMAPSVHAYTAAMRAAAEGGLWQKALDIWNDMEKARCKPTGHAYAAAISACATGGDWRRAIKLFDDMVDLHIRPDVVSCTALITALGTDGQWEHAEKVVDWMLRADVKPNVRTYTALITALGTAKQWERAIELIQRMRSNALGGVEPNSYTYSALLKTMGEQGKWQMAEQVFAELEREQRQSLGMADSPLERQHGSSASLASLVSAATASSSPPYQHTPHEWGTTSDLFYGQDPWEANREQLLRSNEQSLAESALIQQLVGLSLGQPAGPAVHQAQAQDSAEAASSFSLFSHSPPQATPGTAPDQPQAASWTSSSEAMAGLHMLASSQAVQMAAQQQAALMSNVVPAHFGLDPRAADKAKYPKPGARARGPVNEVVCGAMMHAFERSGRWEEALRMLERARRMGIQPNTIMFNTAISALGKAGQWQLAEAVFRQIPHADAVSCETLIAAYGISGEADKAERMFHAMLERSFQPRDYSYCGLIAAHSMNGDWRAALRIRHRMRRAGLTPTIHVYNALIAACERVGQWDQAMELYREMKREGLEANVVTSSLLTSVGRKGVAAIEEQQAAAAALSAAVAAAGTIMMRSGIF